MYKYNTIQIKLRWALFVTYTSIQSIMSSEMCSLHLTHPNWSSGQPTVRCLGSSLGYWCLAQGSQLSRGRFLPEPGVSASRVTTFRHLQEKGYQATSETETSSEALLPGLRRKITGLFLSGPKSSFQMKVNCAFDLEIKVPESGGRVERHRIHVAWSPVWSFHSQWWFGLPCYLLVLVRCVLWSPVNAAIYQEIIEHFMVPSADKLYNDADFISQHDLAPVHTAKGTKSWFNDHGVTVLDWPVNSPDLYPIENLWCIVKRKMRDSRPNDVDDLKAAIKATWASITPEQCHRLIDYMPRHIDAVIHAKGGPTKYWVHRNKHTFQKLDISV